MARCSSQPASRGGWFMRSPAGDDGVRGDSCLLSPPDTHAVAFVRLPRPNLTPLLFHNVSACWAGQKAVVIAHRASGCLQSLGGPLATSEKRCWWWQDYCTVRRVEYAHCLHEYDGARRTLTYKPAKSVPVSRLAARIPWRTAGRE